MAHFAELDKSNKVLRVIVISNDACGEPPAVFPETEIAGCAFITDVLGLSGTWKQTSYSGTFRKNYAGVDFSYSAELDAFIAPQPFPSWVLNEDTCQWESPVPHPADGEYYVWDEDSQSWVADSAG